MEQMGKAAGPTGAVSEMMKASGGFGTDLINNFVKENCITDDGKKSTLVTYLCAVHTELLSYCIS